MKKAFAGNRTQDRGVTTTTIPNVAPFISSKFNYFFFEWTMGKTI